MVMVGQLKWCSMTNEDIKDIKDRWEAGTMPLRLESIEGAEEIFKAYDEMMAWEAHITDLVNALEYKKDDQTG